MIERTAIEQLFAEYAWPMDTMEWDGFGNVFCEDASFSVSITDGPEIGPFEGRDAIVEFVVGTASGQTDVRRHVITNIRIKPESDTAAEATAVLTLVVVDNGSLEVKSSGIYHTHVRREADGQYRFSKMHIALDLAF